MSRSKLDDTQAFLMVAREGSFTRAAAQLGVTPSALSHTVKQLEARLGLRLLARTTRNVSPTDAGERLLRTVGPHFDQIEAELEAIGDLRSKPAGTIRLTCSDYVLTSIIQPRLAPFLRQYPDISVEVAIDNGFTNIVQRRFDAGVRLGEALSKDMIAVRIGPDWRFSVVGAPDYFARYAQPQSPQDLTEHNCINIRLPSAGTIYAWEFEKQGRKINARVEGQLIFNSALPIINATLDGMGLAYLPQDLVQPHIDSGALREVLGDWCPTFQGYHLYYPHPRQSSPAFSLLVEALRYRPGDAA